MKKTTQLSAILLMIAMLPIHLFAQKTSFALSTGYSFAYYNKESSGSASSDMLSGVSLGANARFAMGKRWHFEPGLVYVQKGGVENDISYGMVTTRLHYIDVPFNFTFSKRDRFYFGFGPFVGFAIAGKLKQENGPGYSIKFGNTPEDDLKGVDAGLNMLIGWHFTNNFFCQLTANGAFNNISNDQSYYFSNGYGVLGIGYIFKSKKEKDK